MILLAVLYFVAGVLAASLVWAAIAGVILLRGPVIVLRNVIRRLRQARLVGTPLEVVLEEMEVMHRRLDKARGGP